MNPECAALQHKPAATDLQKRSKVITCQFFFSGAYFISSGYCSAPNKNVSGTTPNNLKLTQTSVEKLRQTISLSTASAKKKNAQRQVSLRQPSSVRSNTESNMMPGNDLSNARPPASVPPNST